MKNCKKCKFYEGRKCHRFPPIRINGSSLKFGCFTFPDIINADISWCGEFKKQTGKTK